VDLDRQSIERRDFPIARRGYDPAAVDAHLRALASDVEEIQRDAAAPGPDSLAASAGSQVQSIVAAAESAAAEIERQAKADAESMRAEAQREAQEIRANAVAQAQAQVAAVGRASATLLSRVESMDGQVSAQVESLRAGATRLAGDLAAVETNMDELYDAAAGRRPAGSPEQEAEAPVPAPALQPISALEHAQPAPPTASEPAAGGATSATPVAGGGQASSSASPSPPIPAAAPAPTAAPPSPSTAGGERSADYDARIVALNMALNGDSREDTDRYLAENYEVPDRKKLLDEVFAAVEG